MTITEHETDIDNHSSTALSLMCEFATTLSSAYGMKKAAVSQTYNTLSTALGKWQVSLRTVIKEYRASARENEIAILKKFTIQLKELKDIKRSIKLWHHVYEENAEGNEWIYEGDPGRKSSSFEQCMLSLIESRKSLNAVIWKFIYFKIWTYFIFHDNSSKRQTIF